MLAPGEKGETGKFLWSLSLLIRPGPSCSKAR